MAKSLMSPELHDALMKLIDHLYQHPGKADLDGRRLKLECGRKYIRVWWSWTELVLLPNGDAFEPKKTGGGRLPDFGKPVGNVIELVKQKGWQKQVGFTLTRYGQPGVITFGNPTPQCDVCGRDKNVRQTALGLRCQYCRSSDVRHMNLVRQLGGKPRIGTRPLHTNKDYYRTT